MKNKKLLTEIDRTRELMGVATIKENLNYKDISNLSHLSIGKLKSDKYFILHHTAGRGTAEGVVNVLNNREEGVLGVQWVIDREGRIFQTLPLGAKGKHIKNVSMPGVPQDINNSTAQGVEIVGNNDSDMLPIQCLSALKLIKELGYSLGQIYGHGEVNKHKARNEGKTCKAFINNHWSDSISELEKEIGTYSFPDLPEEKPLKKNKKSTTSSDNKKSKDVDMNKEKDDDTSIFDIEGAIKKRFEKAGSQIEKLTQNLFK
jgi:hypothetical protein